jgi:hypothetical protein
MKDPTKVIGYPITNKKLILEYGSKTLVSWAELRMISEYRKEIKEKDPTDPRMQHFLNKYLKVRRAIPMIPNEYLPVPQMRKPPDYLERLVDGHPLIAFNQQNEL